MTPPHIEAERTVLGAAMIDARVVDEVADSLRPEHFEVDLHSRAWAAICALVASGDDPSLLAVKHALQRSTQGLPEGAVSDLVGMLDGLPRMRSVEHWARVVRDAARRRALLALAQRLVAQASAQDDETDEILARHQAAIERLMRASDGANAVPLSTAIKEALEDIDRMVSAPSEITGVPTGIPDFDSLTGGLQPGSLYVIAARPRRGKSVFCAQASLHAAGRGRRVLHFALEMTPRQVAKRMLFCDAEVDRYKLRTRPKAYDRLLESAGRLSELPIRLDKREAPTLGQIRSALKRMLSDGGCDLLIVDYLQRCAVDKRIDRYLAIGELMRGLKSLAMSESVPLLVACQVGREGESSKPTLAMLRESGEIEQEADLVAFLHPDEVKGKSPDEVMALEYPQVNLWVEKHRDGAEMMIPLSFERRFARFVNLVREKKPREEKANA